jgi:hypothetical protein
VNFDSITFYTRSLVTDELVFTVAGSMECFDNVHWGIKEVSDDTYVKQSQEVRGIYL